MKRSKAWVFGLPVTNIGLVLGLCRAGIEDNLFLVAVLGVAWIGLLCMIYGKHADAKNMLDYIRPKR